MPPNYDSLIAKLLVHQPTRAEALACMRRALAEFVVEGVKTTIPLHREIFNHSALHRGPGRYDVHRAELAEKLRGCGKKGTVTLDLQKRLGLAQRQGDCPLFCHSL